MELVDVISLVLGVLFNVAIASLIVAIVVTLLWEISKDD